MDKMDYLDLLGREVRCSCGRIHNIPVKRVLVEKGAVDRLIEVLDSLGYSDGYHLVSDVNTQDVAGRRVESLIAGKGRKYTSTFFDDCNLVADLPALERIAADIGDDVSCVIAIGSGSLNDLCKSASFRRGKPYIIVATAPSMDGYTSSVAPIIVNGFKETFSASAPVAVIGDLDILCKAPDHMIAAGFGDILGKFTALCDWKMANIICGEYYCSYIASLVEDTLKSLTDNAKGIRLKSREAVEALMHCLVLSGIAMLMAGYSRPASGSEHHLAHFLEMRFLLEGRKQALHGQKVGVSCVYIAAMYQRLKTLKKTDAERLLDGCCRTAAGETEEKIKRIFGVLAQDVLDENKGLNDPCRRNASILEHWEEISALAEKVPEPTALSGMLKAAGAPESPGDLGIEEGMLRDGLGNCMYIRSRYTVLRLLDDLGVLDAAVEELMKK